MTARLLTVTAFLATLAQGQVAAQAKPNFSGAWKLNVERSDPMGGGPGGPGGGSMASAVTTITQTPDKMTIEVKVGEQPPRVSNYNLDGTESVNTTQRGESKSKVSWEGAGMVITTESSFNGNAFTSKSVRVLSADGKQMTVTTTRQTPNGETTTNQVYDKQ